MASARIATLFLDQELNVTHYTSSVEELFGLRLTDAKDSLTDLAGELEQTGLLGSAREVHNTLEPTYRKIRRGAKRLLAQLRPYRTAENGDVGVALTVFDVSELNFSGHDTPVEEIVSAYERERWSVARDLHEGLGAELAVLAFKAENLTRKLKTRGSDETDAFEETAELEEIAERARRGNDWARTLSSELVPVALQEEHLAAALAHLCRESEEQEKVSVTFEGNRDEPLPSSKETAMHLYHIAREAVANAKQRAKRHVRVGLHREYGRLVMKVSDDGTQAPTAPGEANGLGLCAMRYRARLIGAFLVVEDNESGGTTVQCELPLTTAKSNERSL